MKSVLVYVYNDMADFESSFACHLLKIDGNIATRTFSYEKDFVTTRYGLKIIPDMHIGEVSDIDSFEALIVPGGRPPYFFDEKLPALITSFNDRKKLIAAICLGPLYLAHSGILVDRKFTTSGTEASLRERGIADPFPWKNCTGGRVCADTNIITARGEAFVEFGIEVCRYLGVYKTEEELEQLEEAFGMPVKKNRTGC